MKSSGVSKVVLNALYSRTNSIAVVKLVARATDHVAAIRRGIERNVSRRCRRLAVREHSCREGRVSRRAGHRVGAEASPSPPLPRWPRLRELAGPSSPRRAFSRRAKITLKGARRARVGCSQAA